MIRFFESLALSGHYRSAVTQSARVSKMDVLVRPSGLFEVEPPR